MKNIIMNLAVVSALVGAQSACASVEIRVQNDSRNPIVVELETKGYFCGLKYSKAGIVRSGDMQSASIRSGCEVKQLVVKEYRPVPGYSYHTEELTTVVQLNRKLEDGVHEWSYKSHNNLLGRDDFIEPGSQAARSMYR